MKKQPQHPRRTVIGLFGASLLMGACQPIINGSQTPPSPPRQPPPHTPPSPPRPRDGDRPVTPDDEPRDRRHRRVTPNDGSQGISGTVRNRAGRPVAQVFVQAVALGDTPPVPEIAIFSDARGRFNWPLPPGRYRLTAEHGGRRARADVTVPRSGQARQDLTLS